MPRSREAPGSGAAGRAALATLRDEDFEDLNALVRWLPTMAQTEGRDAAIAFWRTEGRSLVALFRLAKGGHRDDLWAQEGVSVFFCVGVARLLCDPDAAGFNCATAVIEAVEKFLYEPSVRAVFERSAPSEERAYVPNVPA